MLQRVRVILLSFLLLGMQQEAQLHALRHLGDRLASPQESIIHTLQDASACSECTLIAGGSHALAATPGVPFAHLSGSNALPESGFGRSASAPSYYDSRAPPALL